MSTVLTDFTDGVAVITINRPEARDAVDLEAATTAHSYGLVDVPEKRAPVWREQ
jgi:enoyl-CoA hydratase